MIPLSSLNTLGYIEFDVLCNLCTLKTKLCYLPCLSRNIFHAIGHYNCEGEYMINRVYITEKHHPILLKQQSFLTMKNDACCYVWLCKGALFSFDHTPIALHHVDSFSMIDLHSGLAAALTIVMRLMNDV